MAFNNSVNAKTQGTQYLSTAGAWSGIDASTSGFVLTSNGTGVAPAFKVIPALSVVVQTFTSNGTYTPTSGMKYCLIEIGGGGGAGGGANICGGGQYSVGSGGGAGEFASRMCSAATIGASQTVTVGSGGTGVSGGTGNNGGNTSVGTLVSANGGSGGLASAAGSAVNAAPGTGGTGGSNGDYRTPGNYGLPGIGYTTGSFAWGGAGGTHVFGAAGGSQINTGSTTGLAATGHCAGGGGAVNSNSGGATLAGGAGAGGLVVITEWVVA